jgi:hypothetical protein
MVTKRVCSEVHSPALACALNVYSKSPLGPTTNTAKLWRAQRTVLTVYSMVKYTSAPLASARAASSVASLSAAPKHTRGAVFTTAVWRSVAARVECSADATRSRLIKPGCSQVLQGV